MPTVPADPAAVAIAHAIYDSLGMPAENQDGLPVLPHFLKAIPAIQLLDFLKFLGGYSIDPQGGMERYRVPRRDPDKMHALLCAAGRTLLDWPNGFHDFLDLVRRSNVGLISRTGLSGQFGDFYITLMRRFATGHMASVGDAFRTYLNKDGNGALPTRRGHTFEISGDRNFMTRPEVAEFLGVASQTVDVLHKEGEIEGKTHPWGMTRTHGVFSRVSVEAYQERRRHIIDSKTAASRLGLSNVTFRQLVDSGLLEPRQRASYRPRKAYEVDERDIDSLLEKLDEAVTEFPRSAGTNYHNATVRLGNVGLTGANLLEGVIKREIAISSDRIGLTGLQKYLFRSADIERTVVEVAKRLPSRSTLVEVADNLGIDTRVVSRLLNHGALRTSFGKSGIPSVSKADLQRFVDKYVLARELARRKGRPAQHVLDQYCGSGGLLLMGRTLGIANAFLDRQHASRIFGEGQPA